MAGDVIIVETPSPTPIRIAPPGIVIIRGIKDRGVIMLLPQVKLLG